MIEHLWGYISLAFLTVATWLSLRHIRRIDREVAAMQARLERAIALNDLVKRAHACGAITIHEALDMVERIDRAHVAGATPHELTQAICHFPLIVTLPVELQRAYEALRTKP